MLPSQQASNRILNWWTYAENNNIEKIIIISKKSGKTLLDNKISLCPSFMNESVFNKDSKH